jgi:hypothetical protein
MLHFFLDPMDLCPKGLAERSALSAIGLVAIVPLAIRSFRSIGENKKGRHFNLVPSHVAHAFDCGRLFNYDYFYKSKRVGSAPLSWSEYSLRPLEKS